MSGKYGFYIVYNTFLNQPAGTVSMFLSRLENKFDPAGQFGNPFQKRPGPEQHRYVAIMSAGMHNSMVLGSKLQTSLFRYRKCIHVRPQGNTRAAPLTQDSNNPGSTDSGLRGDL
jgi:hypothetical protein